MIYITGDIHAKQDRWYYDIHPLLKKGDYLIVAGDFGFGFDGVFWPKNMFYDWIEKQPYVVLVVDGNHENFDMLDACPVDSWHGGKVHFIRHNLIHLMRGEIFDIEGKTIFAFGGGYSIDKHRRREGISWWPQEMPSKEEYANALINLKKHDYMVDYIVTHTAPINTIEYLSKCTQYGINKDVAQEKPLQNKLQYICDSVRYKHWYFGHCHLDKEIYLSSDICKDQTAIYKAVRALETGKIISSAL